MIFPNSENHCALAATLHFLAASSRAVESQSLPRYHELLKQRASQSPCQLLDVSEVMLWLAQISPRVRQVVHFSRMSVAIGAKVRPSQNETGVLLVDVCRFKSSEYKDMRIHDYQTRLRGEDGKAYRIVSVMHHDGSRIQDGHFWVRRESEGLWQEVDGERVRGCRLERGSRSAVMILYECE